MNFECLPLPGGCYLTMSNTSSTITEQISVINCNHTLNVSMKFYFAPLTFEIVVFGLIFTALILGNRNNKLVEQFYFI